MTLTGRVPDHPATFSTKRVGDAPSIVDVSAAALELLPAELIIFDPYCGLGHDVEAVGTRLGRRFDGIEIELDPALGGSYPNTAPWVRFGDAADPTCYPTEPFVVWTSPPYDNRISRDYRRGPTPATKRNGRLAYGISLGRAPHPRNLAHKVDTKGSAGFYAELADVFKLWGRYAVLNVDLPMRDRCVADLHAAGFSSLVVIEVLTPRARGFDNSNVDDRPRCEVVIAAERPS